MEANQNQLNVDLQLTNGIISKSDVGRLVQEANAVDEFLHQASIRKSGTIVQLPKLSKIFDDVVAFNKLNLLVESDRKQLNDFLKALQLSAPIMHISFSTDPSPVFLQKLIGWVRGQIHPLVLLQIGLHPNIGAGCVVRTTNKYFDFSLRSRFSDQRTLLIESLRGKPVGSSPNKEVQIS